MTVRNIKSAPRRNWKKIAEKAGFDLPDPFEGIKVVDFRFLDPVELQKNEDLLGNQPRLKGLNEEHTRSLVTDIPVRGLEEAAVVTACVQDSTKLAPLTHHRVEAYIRLKKPTIPCFVVEPEVYADGKGRTHQREEILADYTSGIGLNRSQPPKLNLTDQEHLEWLKDKDGWGEFDGMTDAQLPKAVASFLKENLGEIPQKRRTQIKNAFMRNKSSNFKVKPWTRPSVLRETNFKKSTENFWDEASNTLTKVVQAHAIGLGLGSIIQTQKEKFVDYKAAGEEKEYNDLLDDLKVELIVYIGRSSRLEKSKIKADRLIALSDAAVYNSMPTVPVFIEKVTFMPQILQPPQHAETQRISYRWDYTNKKFV